MSKRTRSDSHEPQGSAKRSNQDHDLLAEARFDKAQRLFQRARDEQLHTKLKELLAKESSPEELQAAYTPLFQKLAQTISGRDDIPVPPPREWAMKIALACEDPLNFYTVNSIKEVIDYIMTENKKPPLPRVEPKSLEISQAVANAWDTPYVGAADELLRDAITSMYEDSKDKPYKNFCAIIQGSGTGKSRVVDKLAESAFAIPSILRPLDDRTGFPFGDVANGQPLIEFFRGFNNFGSAQQVQRRFLNVLLKTIAYANKWIDEQKKKGLKPEEFAKKWRVYLGPPQSTTRIEMYTKAIDPSLLDDFKDIFDENITDASLSTRAREYIISVSAKLQLPGTKGPAIVFYFDEAHHLTQITVTKSGLPHRTAYQCLCKAFTYMVKAPVFALFLSTYSRLSEFAPSARNFWSSRPQSILAGTDDDMNAPFVELPFDCWEKPIIVREGGHSEQEICSLEFKARFGRPLFWALYKDRNEITDTEAIGYAKLKLALRWEGAIQDQALGSGPILKELIPLLAARVDLTFESNRDEAVLLEGLLVASSMRTVYSVPQHRQYLRGGYSSEPFVAEAAARAIFERFQADVLEQSLLERPLLERPVRTPEIIDKIIARYKNDIPSAISQWFNRGLIDKGQRGELVARILVTLAHDISILKNPTFIPEDRKTEVSFSHMVPVVDFLRALISKEHIEKVLKSKPSNLSGKTLEEAFKDAYVHFTQFVKAGDKSTITDEALYLLFIRAAAIQGYDNMAQADLVIPVWIRRDGNPDRWCMTAIFIQVKNRVDKQFIFIDAQKTFNFFTSSTMPADKGRPYITIAMELGMLAPEQKKTPQPELVRGRKPSENAKGKGRGRGRGKQTGKGKQEPVAAEQKKTSQTKVRGGREQSPPTTPPRNITAQTVLSPAEVRVTSRGRDFSSRDVKKADTHPRYQIDIIGCSNRVYNVIGEVSYASLLANKNILAEHPRVGVYVDAVKRMKPYWEIESSYHWAEMKNESRLRAPTFAHQDNTVGAEEDSDNCYDSDDEIEGTDGVFVG